MRRFGAKMKTLGRPFVLAVACGAALTVSSCVTPEVRSEAPRPPPAAVRSLPDGGVTSPDLIAGHDVQQPGRPEDRRFRVLVTFTVTPPEAKVHIGEVEVPRRGNRPRTWYLTPGTHNVRAEDPKGILPALAKTIDVGGEANDFPLDLTKNLGELVVASDSGRGYELWSEQDEKLSDSDPLPHRIRPGTRVLRFRSRSKCYVPDPDTPLKVTIAEGEKRTVSLHWKDVPPDVLEIMPYVDEGGVLLPAPRPIVSIDGRIASSLRGTTAYEIPCTAEKIEVLVPGYRKAESRRAVGGVFPKSPWKPLLEQDMLAERHVDCHEVTVEEYEEFIKSTGSRLLPRSIDIKVHNWHEANKKERRRHPVNALTYEAASKFCAWRARESGHAGDGRVADEEDLRAAAGYADSRLVPWGGQERPSCERVQMNGEGLGEGCSGGHTTEVCSMGRGHGPYGHCDILGNVEEWVGPGKVLGGSFRDSLKGGRLDVGRAQAPYNNVSASDRVGFRCAWPLSSPSKCSCPPERVDHATH